MASALFYCGSEEYSGAGKQQIGCREHFLEACFMCQKLLGFNRDIFMYRGNTAFCSKECRQEQIEIDEATQRRNLSGSATALRKTAQSTANELPEGSCAARSAAAGAVSVA